MVIEDPRHGRWILPLIIAAMVILTYTFVNSLEPATDPTGTTDAEPPFPTDSASSTTTLPADIAAFMATVDVFENQATAYRDQVLQVNTDWEDRINTGLTYAQARTRFLELQTQLDEWENTVTEVAGVPTLLAQAHVDLIVQVSDLSAKVGDIVLGLEAPDDGTQRRAAVEEFKVEVQQVLDAIADLRIVAQGGTVDSSTTSTTGGDTSGSTTTEG